VTDPTCAVTVDANRERVILATIATWARRAIFPILRTVQVDADGGEPIE
jgi:hypothetical protein